MKGLFRAKLGVVCAELGGPCLGDATRLTIGHHYFANFFQSSIPFVGYSTIIAVIHHCPFWISDCLVKTGSDGFQFE